MSEESKFRIGAQVWELIKDTNFIQNFLNGEISRDTIGNRVFERYTGANVLLPDVIYVCVRNDIVDFVWRTIGKEFSPNPMGLEKLEDGEGIIAKRLAGEGIKSIEITMVGIWNQFEAEYIWNEFPIFIGMIVEA